jgi:hypothetical protein
MIKTITGITEHDQLLKELQSFSNFQSFWAKLDGEIELTFSDNSNETEVDAFLSSVSDALLAAKKDKAAQLEAIKKTMDQNIINEAMAVTGATSIESAQAFVQAFQLRMANPAEYVNEGLKVYYAIDTYSLGEDLDTETKITDYYKKVVVYLDKFREAEIASYLSQKAVIEAS